MFEANTATAVETTTSNPEMHFRTVQTRHVLEWGALFDKLFVDALDVRGQPIQTRQMEMCSIASKDLVPFLFSDLYHQLDDALDALAETDRSGPGLVELLVAPNVVAFFGDAGEIIHVCKRK